MASFIDKPAQFSPYIPQLPLQAMVEVGMEKQRRYDEGLQKIQQNIDRIMDLDIAKDGHKDYLQSKLNNLGTDLKFVAAGDFSNSQLVKSVSGMASKIGKDPIVQNAVSSTAFYRKQIANMDDDRKNGKLSPANEFYFGSRASNWFNDPNLETPFTTSYIPNFDITKHLTDVINTLKPDGFMSSQIFQTDEKGDYILETVVDPTTGQKVTKPILSTTMSTLKQEGIFPKKVEAAISAALADPRVAQQMQIDGEYQYRGLGSEDLAVLIQNEKQQQISNNNKLIYDLRLDAATTNSNGEKLQINEQISKLEGSLNSINSQFDNLTSQAYSNPNALKGFLYTSKMKDSWREMYTSIKEERKIEDNPAWKAEWEMHKFAEELRIKEDERALAWAKFGQEKYEFETTYEFNQKKLKIENPEAFDKPVIDKMPGDIDLVEGFETDVNTAATVFGKAADEILFATIIDPKYLEVYTQKFGKDAKRMLIESYARNSGYGNDVTTFRTDWLRKAEKKVNEKYGGYSNNQELLELKNSLENARQNFGDLMDIKKQVDAIAPITDDSDDTAYERRNEALRQRLYLNPTLRMSLDTEKEPINKMNYSRVGGLISSRLESGTNLSKDFVKNAPKMLAIANIETDSKGSIDVVVDENPVTKETTVKLEFIGSDGKVGEMTITPDEARYAGRDISEWRTSPELKRISQKIQVNRGKTSAGNPAIKSTYLVNDAAFMKKDFPNLSGYPRDIKGNIKEIPVVGAGGITSTKYVPYIYVSGTKTPRSVGSYSDLGYAIQVLTELDSKAINAIIKDEE